MSTGRLPPLDLLRSFAAVAHEGSVSRAAERLYLTQGAVSRQIQQLEAALGLALFQRQARGVTPTEAGQELLAAVDLALDHLGTTIERLRGRGAGLQLKLLPTLALRWFLPRLPGFQKAHPDIEIRISTAEFQRVDFAREGFDAAIVYDRAEPEGIHALPLFAEHLTPACAPALAERLGTPADLAGFDLIHLTPDHAHWRQLLARAGIAHPRLAAGPSFESNDMAVNVASQGLGVALADPLLFADDIAARRLALPFPELQLETGYRYWFACPRARRDDAAINALQAWLLAQLEGTNG
ncbi:LysR substrate-binding domain-containing protein [Chitinimonas koreensis]|uniref:LysR substrate-binding domain-containing protein n=1 Tax=Chitinimonas koreensis TaxID=356302 RepID=UPI00040D1FBC|nr:LysR substrate-binding domain-containing protein [Chitinimonas koreensis]QNM97805.1 LysR family transcriptional regulator [Chitinimonas koreensis]